MAKKIKDPETTERAERFPTVVRMDEEVRNLVQDVHHELRFPSQHAAIVAMIKAGGDILLKDKKKS